jgi:hypothetical protein
MSGRVMKVSITTVDSLNVSKAGGITSAPSRIGWSWLIPRAGSFAALARASNPLHRIKYQKLIYNISQVVVTFKLDCIAPAPAPAPATAAPAPATAAPAPAPARHVISYCSSYKCVWHSAKNEVSISISHHIDITHFTFSIIINRVLRKPQPCTFAVSRPVSRQ